MTVDIYKNRFPNLNDSEELNGANNFKLSQYGKNDIFKYKFIFI